MNERRERNTRLDDELTVSNVGSFGRDELEHLRRRKEAKESVSRKERREESNKKTRLTASCLFLSLSSIEDNTFASPTMLDQF